jgi:hypothetical protein
MFTLDCVTVRLETERPPLKVEVPVKCEVPATLNFCVKPDVAPTKTFPTEFMEKVDAPTSNRLPDDGGPQRLNLS